MFFNLTYPSHTRKSFFQIFPYHCIEHDINIKPIKVKGTRKIYVVRPKQANLHAEERCTVTTKRSQMWDPTIPKSDQYPSPEAMHTSAPTWCPWAPNHMGSMLTGTLHRRVFAQNQWANGAGPFSLSSHLSALTHCCTKAAESTPLFIGLLEATKCLGPFKTPIRIKTPMQISYFQVPKNIQHMHYIGFSQWSSHWNNHWNSSSCIHMA